MDLVLIIMLSIIGVIFKLFGTMGDSKQGTGSGTSGRPVVSRNYGGQDKMNGEGNIYRQSGDMQMRMSSAEKGGAVMDARDSEADAYAARVEGFSLEGADGFSLEGKGLEDLKDVRSDGETGAVKLEIIPSGARSHTLSFSRHDVINGIIMSELLQPPKALRRRTMR